jgi:hypothetical protein
MIKEELISKSPIRILERSIHGGLGRGNLGVFAARKGVGKTACLVHVAIDKLLRGQRVLHISFADDPDHIKNWYKQVFSEVARAAKLQDAEDSYLIVLQHRLIMHFRNTDVSFAMVHKNIQPIITDGQFSPELVIVDGYPFAKETGNELSLWKQLARDLNVEIWFSATLHRESMKIDEGGIPSPISKFADFFSVIIMLEPTQNHIDFNLLKDRDSSDLEKMRLKLDPKTLLLANHRV